MFVIGIYRQIRIFADEYQIQNAECALNTTVKAFDFFQDFFDVDLPLNKYGQFNDNDIPFYQIKNP